MGPADIWRAGAIVILIATLRSRRSSAIDFDAPACRSSADAGAAFVSDRRRSFRRAAPLQRARVSRMPKIQRCKAVWTENRRRFFGRPARPTPPDGRAGHIRHRIPPHRKSACAMNGTGVIDRFLKTFTPYIDSGFGLLEGRGRLSRHDADRHRHHARRRCSGHGAPTRTSSHGS